jgi:hypothetical protein
VSDKTAAQWSFIFEQMGKENLREMLMKAAIEKEGSDRVVIEFRDDRAMNITDHVDELETEADLNDEQSI